MIWFFERAPLRSSAQTALRRQASGASAGRAAHTSRDRERVAGAEAGAETGSVAVAVAAELTPNR